MTSARQRSWLTRALGAATVLAFAGLLQWLVSDARARGRDRPAPAEEACLRCHGEVVGLEASHARLGCSACHLGNARSTNETIAHLGLVLIPGQDEDVDRTCGAAGCHPQMPGRLRSSIMTTMNGVVSVDRWVFGELERPTAHTPVSSLGTSPAELHLRNLCASCHLTAVKTEPGPVEERSRGGGCVACHLQYSDAARASLERWRASTPSEGAAARGSALDSARAERGSARAERGSARAEWSHPQLRARPTALHCFGCHSRSGRISLNYEGWREADPSSTPGDVRPSTPLGVNGGRILADGRRLLQVVPDVHASRGLTCVDCHTSWEVMGDGTYALHREDQSSVACFDCHLIRPPVTRAFRDADPEAQKLTQLLGGDVSPERRFLTVARTGAAFTGTRVSPDGGLELEALEQRPALPLARAAPACAEDAAHRALACPACHDAWAPQCTGCHTAFDAGGTMFDLLTRQERAGRFEETPGASFAEPASLGVRERPGDDGGTSRRIEEFTPGMVLSLARTQAESAAPVFRRLFAATFPHTVQRTPRSCASCHADPLALGYGRGRLTFERGRFTFAPERPLSPFDGLPEDAWIGFLSEPGPGTTTRETTRPFSLAEQRRILTVGACLGCHPPGSPPMRAALQDFTRTLTRRSARCALPLWSPQRTVQAARGSHP